MSDSCYKNFIVLASQPSNLPSGESICWPYQVFHDCQERRCPIRYANIPFSGLDSLNKYGLRYALEKRGVCLLYLRLPAHCAKTVDFPDDSGCNAPKGSPWVAQSPVKPSAYSC